MDVLLLLLAFVSVITRDVHAQLSVSTGCSAIGQYILHPTNRCQYYHCVYLGAFWLGNRSPQQYGGVVRHCPYGTGAPRSLYHRHGGYSTFHLSEICSEWVSAPKWTDDCEVHPRRNHKLESNDLHVHYALPQTINLRQHGVAERQYREPPTVRSPDFKKAYDDGYYTREEIAYDVDNTQLLEDSPKLDDIVYDDEPSVNNSPDYVQQSPSYNYNYDQYADDYVMDADQQNALWNSISQVNLKEEAELMSADESTRMKAEMIALGS